MDWHARIFKYSWNKPIPFALWVVRSGDKRRFDRTIRYFRTWDEAREYVFSGKSFDVDRRINLGIYTTN